MKMFTYFGLFCGPKGPENMTPGIHDLHTPEITSDMPVNQVPCYTIKTVCESGQNHNFDLFWHFSESKGANNTVLEGRVLHTATNTFDMHVILFHGNLVKSLEKMAPTRNKKSDFDYVR